MAVIKNCDECGVDFKIKPEDAETLKEKSEALGQPVWALTECPNGCKTILATINREDIKLENLNDDNINNFKGTLHIVETVIA
jgi:hypothetical protein